jgi:succinate dehydrogenase / fumarate reductase membrane anchor subunit
MVKTVLGVNHQGLRDWMVQHLSAFFMAIYSIGLIAYLVTHTNLDFSTWQLLFSHTWMKISTIMFVGLVLMHAWVGMWTIFTDYVKPYVLCLTLNGLVLFFLAACFIWTLQILWGV